MQFALDILRQHGYLALFGVLLIDQMGIPMPSLPLLMGAGALVGLGYLHPIPALLAVVLGALLADLAWYELGRRRGAAILGTLCKISLEPDSCVQQTEGVFDRYGDRCLLFAKFIPGLSTVTPPVAGMIGLPLRRFVLLDGLGVVLWAGFFGGLGWLFAGHIEWMLMRAQQWGATLGQLLAGGFLLYLGVKAWHRYRFLRTLRIARVTPEELHEMLGGPEAPFIVDLRNRLQQAAHGVFLPGAHRLAVEELAQRAHELPRDRDIVVYCS